MASNHKFLSVLDKPTGGSGTIDLIIETIDADSNVVISASASVSEGDPEGVTAKAIQDALAAAITTAEADYSGAPVFSTESPAATFRVTRTENGVCIWSQCEFTVQVDTSNAGCIVSNSSTPVFLTNAELVDYAAICGLDVCDLTDDQKAIYLELASAAVVKITSNPIVMTSQLATGIGNGQISVHLPVRPVLSYDAPRSRAEAFNLPSVDAYASLGYSAKSFRLNSRLGTLRYASGSMILDALEPFALGSEWLVSYIAGSTEIPKSVKQATVMLADQLNNNAAVKSLKAADFNVDLYPSDVAYKQVRRILSSWIL